MGPGQPQHVRIVTDRLQMGPGERGDHLVEILAYTKTLAVAVPPTIRVSARVERLERPRGQDVRPGWLDPALGIASVRLSWFNDLRAGGWRLARREQVSVGELLELGDADRFGILDDRNRFG